MAHIQHERENTTSIRVVEAGCFFPVLHFDEKFAKLIMKLLMQQVYLQRMAPQSFFIDRIATKPERLHLVLLVRSRPSPILTSDQMPGY